MRPPDALRRRTRAHAHARTHTHTHTHPFNGPLSGTTQVSQYQKGKTNLDFTGARDSEWQWHQLGHMQVCTSLQADNHASTPPLSFLQAGCTSCRPTNSVKALNALQNALQIKSNLSPSLVGRSGRLNSHRQHDKTVLSASRLVCRFELDDCSERVQTSHFLSATVLSCPESNSHRRSGRDTDKTVLSSLAWRCEFALSTTAEYEYHHEYVK